MTSQTPDRFRFEERKEAQAPPGMPGPARAATTICGGLLAAVLFVAGIDAVAGLVEGERVTAATVGYLAAVLAGLVLAIYLCALGLTGDSRRALRLTGKVLLWTGIAVAVIAAIALAGGFGWGSDSDSDSDSDGGGDKSGSDSGGWFGGWSFGSTSDTAGGGSPGGGSKPSSSAPASVCMGCGKRMAAQGGFCSGCAFPRSW
jgi:hypothetical protein